MTDVQRLKPMSCTPGKETVYGAWERFVQGEDDIGGVRPEVAISWQRCRDQYRVDPHLTEAPAAITEVDHTLEHDVVFAELGFRAASVAHEVSNLGGVVTVSDATGRILAEWGDQATRTLADKANLAPWFCWSEYSTGTNGMGTALEAHAPVMVRGAEHWCQAFHDWTCAGVAVRNVVTKEPVAVLNISCWRSDVPGAAGAWLSNAATKTQEMLRRRARDDGAELVAAYNHARSRSSATLAAVDLGGRVVIADDTASVLLGVPGSTPALDATVRWKPGVPELIHAARYASKQVTRNPDWIGSTQIFTHLGDEPTPIRIQPVFLSGHMIGNLISFGVSEGANVPREECGVHAREKPNRIVAMRDNRMVLMRPREIAFAEAEGNDVWLSTDQGRLRAASAALDKFESGLGGTGFLRVHRRYVVNISRIREVERGFKGELVLVMDNQENTMVPVSRRNTPVVRRVLDI